MGSNAVWVPQANDVRMRCVKGQVIWLGLSFEGFIKGYFSVA